VELFADLEILTLWLAWSYSYFFRAPKVQKRESITVVWPSRIGILLEVAGIFIVWWFRAADGPRNSPWALIAALILGLIGVVLMWTAVTHLGRQFRLHAGLYHDHELVHTGPYAIVRHPIYASLLALTLSTGVLLSQWPWFLAGVVVFLAGTEIRVYIEEKLLAARFGKEFAEYKSRVPAYLPLVR
jgi:isoprenylcysteine carboxyl methyltransferase (ICMT) family protein YpbQ